MKVSQPLKRGVNDSVNHRPIDRETNGRRGIRLPTEPTSQLFSRPVNRQTFDRIRAWTGRVPVGQLFPDRVPRTCAEDRIAITISWRQRGGEDIRKLQGRNHRGSSRIGSADSRAPSRDDSMHFEKLEYTKTRRKRGTIPNDCLY